MPTELFCDGFVLAAVAVAASAFAAAAAAAEKSL